MKYNYLGKTGIKVSELCFGTLPMGPLHAKISAKEGHKVILEGLNRGINFIDTAQIYRTYPHIKKALSCFDGEVIIASKSKASKYNEMKEAVFEACQSLGKDYIDIFHLHAARANKNIFKEREEALSCLIDLKKEGVIRAIGISTHAIEVVKEATINDSIDIIFPIINQAGLGIIDGKAEDMILAIKEANLKGKGIYAMKALAGGFLIDKIEKSINFIRQIKEIQSVAVGMINKEELDIDINIFENKEIKEEQLLKIGLHKKRLIISRFCVGCGTCVEACPNKALSLVNGKAVVNYDLCITCGYCVPYCPEFAIRIS